jgi:hypothetical protein
MNPEARKPGRAGESSFSASDCCIENSPKLTSQPSHFLLLASWLPDSLFVRYRVARHSMRAKAL